MSKTNLRICRKFNLTWSLVRMSQNQFISFDEKIGRFTGKGTSLIEKLALNDKHE